jgi:hypothetical protein
MSKVDFNTIGELSHQAEWVRSRSIHLHTPGEEYTSFSIGSDPEIFLMKGDEVFPAFQFLPSKKEAKVQANTGYRTGAFYQRTPFWDGFQAEFCAQPKECLMYFTLGMRKCLEGLAMRAGEKGAKLTMRNVLRIPDSMLLSAEQEHVALGCSPSENIYDDHGIQVENPRKLKYRFAGGHLHFGKWFPEKPPEYAKIVNTLDSILAVWAVGVAANIDSPIRRKYYGLAGEYRTPTYKKSSEYGKDLLGVEYRVLSNYWLCHPAICHATWEVARACVKLAHTKYRDLWVADKDLVREIVNNCDVKQARRLLELNRDMFIWMVQSYAFPTIMVREAIFNLGMNGVESIVSDPEDLTKNWLFGNSAHDDYNEKHSQLSWYGYVMSGYKGISS